MKQLWLSSNNITNLGYSSIAQFLRNDEINLKTLYLTNNQTLGVETAQELADALGDTKTLEYIDMPTRTGYNRDVGGIKNAVSGLRKAVCNQTSFEALCNSNHSLWSIGEHATEYISGKSSRFRVALDVNARDCSIGAKIRAKLRCYYFNGEFSIQPFVEMPAKFIPSALELASMSEELCGEKEGRLEWKTPVLARNSHLGGIYRIVRNYWNLQELFSFVSPEAKLEVTIQQQEAEIAKLKLEVELINKAAAGAS